MTKFKLIEKKVVVASKISRTEFINFKKLCDAEAKTSSTKIRELINKEANKNKAFVFSFFNKIFEIKLSGRNRSRFTFFIGL